MGKFEFGIRVPNSGPLSSKENIVRAAQNSEELGFDTVWLHDHVVWSSEMHRHHISSGATEAITDAQEANFFECMTTMSYLAAKTKDIQIGVACLVMPLRNPIYAAKQCATLDHLCDGRLLVGVGLGSKATRESTFSNCQELCFPSTFFNSPGSGVSKFFSKFSYLYTNCNSHRNY